MSRTTRRTYIALAIAFTTGLVLAMVDGAPDPGAAIRAYAAAMGCLAVLGATSFLRRGRRSWSGAGAVRSAGEREIDAADPEMAAWQELERAVRFGAVTIGDYRLIVQPRLSALAAARLARRGQSLSDTEAAEALFGEAFYLIDPRIAMPSDRLGPGVPVAAVESLLRALEEL